MITIAVVSRMRVVVVVVVVVVVAVVVVVVVVVVVEWGVKWVVVVVAMIELSVWGQLLAIVVVIVEIIILPVNNKEVPVPLRLPFLEFISLLFLLPHDHLHGIVLDQLVALEGPEEVKNILH